MLPPQVRKFDIVEQFSGDADGSRLREVVQRLQQNREAYAHRMNTAYDAALNALPNLWERARRDEVSGQSSN